MYREIDLSAYPPFYGKNIPWELKSPRLADDLGPATKTGAAA